MKWAGIILLACSVASCSDSEPIQRARLIDSDGGVQLELTITIADTEQTRQEGLRLHGPLGEDEGLLLVFPTETTVCITNTGVPFPIDVVYLSTDRMVTAIEQRIPPDAAGPFCHRHTAMALELPGDTLRPLNYAKLELF
jgi:uncharacterized membrane protein (UPF0127 family)